MTSSTWRSTASNQVTYAHDRDSARGEDDVAAMEVIGRVTWPESVWMEPNGAPGD
jgi:hypothetical protein